MPFIDNDFLELKDCVFIKGLPTNANIEVSDVRQYFEERIGECCVEMTSRSKDKRWFFLALKFKSPSVAENVMERFGGKYIFGHRATMSHWRVPRSEALLGRLQQDSRKPNTRTWENRENIDGNADVDKRHKEAGRRERHSWNIKHASSDLVEDRERGDFREDSDNIRHYRDNEGQCKTSDNYSYEEQTEEYYPQCWDTEGMGEFDYYEENWNGWDSGYNGSSENFPEREKYDREEELSYRHEEDICQGREVNQDDNQASFNQNHSWNYDDRCHEPDRNQEFYCEQYEGSFSQEHVDSHYDSYRNRPEETSHENEDLRERIREWRVQRENSRMQDLQTQRQGDISNNFSRFDEENHRSRWEITAPTNPTRRRLSDPDVRQREWEQDFADRRSGNNSRDFIGRERENLPEERLRSDEWLESGWRRVENGGRRSTSPVNLRSRDYSHQEFPLPEEGQKGNREAFDTRVTVDRKHGGDFVHLVRSHHASTTSTRKRNSPSRSTRGSSSEASPQSERFRYSCSEQSSDRRLEGSCSFASRERHHNSRVQNERGRPERSKREGDLRRSLMEHQHRKHFSSTAEDRSKEEGTNYSSLGRGRKSSPDEHYRSTGSRSSAEFTFSAKTGNRKRHHEDEKTRLDMESVKKRKETSHTSTSHFDAASSGSESRGSKPSKSPGERRTYSPRDHLSRTGRPREKVSVKSSTKRADCLLNDLAVTLAEDNISLRRPSPNVEVKHRNFEGKKDPTGKSHNRSSPSKRSDKKCQDQDNKMNQTVRDEDLQLVDSRGGVLCAKETVADWYTAEESSEGETTTSEGGTTWQTGFHFGGTSDQDADNVTEACESPKVAVGNSFQAETSSLTLEVNCKPLKNSLGHPMPLGNAGQHADEVIRFFEDDNAKLPDNSHNAAQSNVKTAIQPLRPSPKPSEFTEIKTNFSYIVDKFEKTPELVNKETEVLEKLSKEESKQLNPCLEHSNFEEIQTNNTFIFDDFMKTQKVEANEDVLPLKTTGIRSVRQDGNLRVESRHIVDEFSSDDQISPDVTKSGNEFCYTMDSSNVERKIVDNGREEKCINKKGGLNTTRPKKKTLNSGGVTSSGIVSSLYRNQPSVRCKEVKHVGGDTLEQGTYEVKSKAAHSSRNNTAGLCLPHTEPRLYYVKVNRDREEALTQRSYNIEDRNCIGRRKRAGTAMDDGQVNTICTEEELSNCNSSNVADQSQQMEHPLRVNKLVKEITDRERDGSRGDDLGSKKSVTDGAVKELTQVNNPNTNKETILKSGNEVHGKIAQEDICHDNDGDDYNAMIQGYNVGHGHENNNGQETTPGEGIDFTDISQVGSKKEKNCSAEWGGWKGTKAEATYRDQGRLNERSFDAMSNENGTNDAYNIRTKEGKDSGSAALISKEDLRKGKSGIVTCYDNSGVQKRSKEKNVDFDQTLEGQKGDGRASKMSVMNDFCVTHKKIQIGNVNSSDTVNEMHSSQEFTACANGREKNEDHVTTQQKIHSSDKIYLSVDPWNKDEGCPTVHKNGLSSQENLSKQKCCQIKEISKAVVVSNVSSTLQKTVQDCRSFDVSNLEHGGCSNVSQADPGTIDRSCLNWSQIESYQSNLDNASETASSPLNTCSSNHGLLESEASVPENLEHVDMEISSDEEHRSQLINPITCVVDEASGAKPYSPSSPTVKSDDQCSPRPKDSSPYSPSYPTNVSEGDVDQNDPVKELSYHKDDTHDVSACKDREIIAGPLKNSFQDSNAGDSERKVTAQAISNNSIDVCSESLSTVSSEKSNSRSLLSMPTVEDALDVNLPANDVAPFSDRKRANSEYGGVDDEGIAASSCNSSPKNIEENCQKPLISCPERTQSLSNVSTVVPKPKILYISATKSNDVNVHETLPSKIRNNVDRAIKSGNVNCTVNITSFPSSEKDNDANEDILTVNTSGNVNSEPLTILNLPGSGNTEGGNNSISRSDNCKATREHASPLSPSNSSYYQHNKRPLSSAENVRNEEHREEGTGLESDRIALRMERLRKKKEQIEEVYKRECQTVINVVKMLVSNDPRLEGILQNSVRRSLQEMGQRCVQELEKDIRPTTRK